MEPPRGTPIRTKGTGPQSDLGLERAFGEPDGGGKDRRWLWLAFRLAQDLWDDELWHALATRSVNVARDTGALHLLPNALN